MPSTIRPFRYQAHSLRSRLTVTQLESRDLLAVFSIGQAFMQAIPNDTSFGSLYGMQKIQAPAAWDLETGSRDVIVADIDSGIDYAHPDLYKNVWINQGELPQEVKNLFGGAPVTFYDLNNKFLSDPTTYATWDTDSNYKIDGKDVLALWSDTIDSDGNRYTDDLIGWNFVNNTNDPFDDNGHGTHTAGTIGAMGNNSLGVAGVNWEVQIMPLKFIAGDGSGSLDWAANAIRYAADNGAPVSNNSWVYFGGTTGDVIHQAVDYARTHNHLLVAAAGNDGFNNDNSPWRSYPASFGLSNIISVTATDSQDNKPSWANTGKTSVDLGAPGLNVLSTLPGGAYGYGSGTSMATPHVAGTAALILAAHPELTASSVKSLILNNVDKVKSLANKTVTGGRLNAFRALTGPTGGASSFTGDSGSDSGGNGGHGSGKAATTSLDTLGLPGSNLTEPASTAGTGSVDSNWSVTGLTPSEPVCTVEVQTWDIPSREYPYTNATFDESIAEGSLQLDALADGVIIGQPGFTLELLSTD